MRRRAIVRARTLGLLRRPYRLTPRHDMREASLVTDKSLVRVVTRRQTCSPKAS
jgi:hypothetical protein